MTDQRKSAELFARALKVSPGGVHSPVRSFRDVGGTPRFIDHAEGAWLIDVDDNRYIDFCMSWGPLIFGHNDPEIAAAAKHAIGKGSSYGAAEKQSLELAELITGNIPWVEKIRFVNSGTEAVMGALRLARAATGRSKIVKFEGCYHGHSDSMLVRAGSGLAGTTTADSAGVPAGVTDDTLIAKLDDSVLLGNLFAEHGTDIAAVIIEPLPANYGLLPQHESFLKQTENIARQHGALLILDEVISGFRLGFGGAAESYGIRPDLVTYGKIIGGGFPVGAYGGRAELMDLIAPAGPVYQAGTLSANSVAMAAGLTTLRKLLRDQPYAGLANKISNLRSQLASYESNVPISLQVRSAGSLFWLALSDSNKEIAIARSPTQIPAAQKHHFPALFNSLLERGYYLAPSPFEVGFLSTAHTDEQLDAFADAIGQVLASWA